MSLSRSVFAAGAACAALLCAAPAAAATPESGPSVVRNLLTEFTGSSDADSSAQESPPPGGNRGLANPLPSDTSGPTTTSQAPPGAAAQAPAAAAAPARKPSDPSANRFNCDDFPNRAAAQDTFEEDRSDPNVLDRDNDGKACESFFPATTGGQVPVMPAGGVAAGSGPAPQDGSSALGLVGALGALAAAGTAGVVAGRRRLARRGN